MLTWYWKGKRLCREEIETGIRDKKLILFGADIKRNQQLFKEIDKDCIPYIFDNDVNKWEDCQEGIRIMEPFKAEEDVVLISGIYDWQAISGQAKELGYEEPYFFLTEDMEAAVGKCFSFFSPDVYNNAIDLELSYKYIHFIADEKFFASVIEFIEYGLEVREHFFVIYGLNAGNRNDIYGIWDKYKELSEKYHNIYLYYEDGCRLNLADWDCNKGKLDQLLEKAEKVIFHGECLTPGMCDYFHDRVLIVREKGVFIPWGGDIGRNPYTTSVIEKILQYARMIPYSYPIDKETIINYFPIAANAIWIRNKISYARLTQYADQTEEHTNNILIAHSPHDYTMATETLQYLAGIDCSVQVYCIASYGLKEDIEKISYWGEKCFGSQFHLVSQYMNYGKYVEFLSTMDLVVFGMECLSGRDTLELLFWLGKKVYLKPGSEAFTRMEAAGYKINNYYMAKEDIKNKNFDNPDKAENHAVAENEFNPEKKLKQWKALYEYRFDTAHQEEKIAF